MVGFDGNVAVKGEWLDRSPEDRKRSKAELDREVSLEARDSRGSLSERIAARAGLNVPRLKTENILRSPGLNISSPVLSPATLLESPVFLSNPLLSPTTGKFSSIPYEKAKDEFIGDIATSLPVHSISTSFDPTIICLEPNDTQDYEQRQLSGLGDSVASSAPADDGYNWRKYGQKLVKGSEYPRSYYKCTHPNCEVKKKVERSREGHITEIIYTKSHNHPKPPPNRRSGIGSSSTVLDMQVDGIEQTERENFIGTYENIEWTSPISAEFEYASLQVQNGTQFGYGDASNDSFLRDDDEVDRTTHMSVSLSYDGEVDESESKRRKLEAYATEMTGSTRAAREPRVMLQTTSDIDILEDGYRWRNKYGQKVVKGNPNPRSYYKCTATGCTVTKHVERASDDLTSVITTYIGKHTHHVPASRNNSQVGSGGSGTLQCGLASQAHNHQGHYPVPQSRSERLITANSSLFDFQPHLRPPSASSVFIAQDELLDFAMPSLSIGQDTLPGMPEPAIGDTAGLMMQVGAEPKVEPVTQEGFGLSSSSLVYREIMSRLPRI